MSLIDRLEDKPVILLIQANDAASAVAIASALSEWLPQQFGLID